MYAQQRLNQLIVDFCTGTAAVPLILSTKYLAKIKGIEIQKNVSKLAYNPVVLNNLENQIEIINDNLSSALEYILPESVDAITCNPPYFKMNEGSYLNIDEEKRIARHEITTNLEQIIVTAKYLLRNRAPIYMVHRPERLMEIINLLTMCRRAGKLVIGFDAVSESVKNKKAVFSKYIFA